MSFFAKLGYTISEGGKKVVRGVNDFTEAARLKDEIAAEEKTQDELYARLGRLFTERSPEQCRCEPFCVITQEICDSEEAAGQLRRQLESVQAGGGKPCPVCGERCVAEARFCASCGSQFRQVEPECVKTCASCSAVIDEADAFCRSCGERVDGG